MVVVGKRRGGGRGAYDTMRGWRLRERLVLASICTLFYFPIACMDAWNSYDDEFLGGRFREILYLGYV